MRAKTLTWTGGEHDFALPIELLRALQTKCDAGPAWVLNRLRTGEWLVDDVVETIRFGLEGGGSSKDEARTLVKKHIEDEPIANFVLLAQVILLFSVYGDEDGDTVGESEAGEDQTEETHSREEKSDSPSSTSTPEA